MPLQLQWHFLTLLSHPLMWYSVREIRSFVEQTTDNNSRTPCLPSPTVLLVPAWRVSPHSPLTMVSPAVCPSLSDQRWQVCAAAGLWAAGQEAAWARHQAPAATFQCHRVLGRRSRAPWFCPRHRCLLSVPPPCLCKFIQTGWALIDPWFPI